MPALLTRIFRAGKPEASHSTSDFLDAALETSQTWVCNPGNCFFADCSRWIRRPQITTALPRLINSWARAKPIPVPPPVMRTVLPDVFNSTSHSVWLNEPFLLHVWIVPNVLSHVTISIKRPLPSSWPARPNDRLQPIR